MGILITYRKPGSNGELGPIIEQFRVPDGLTEIQVVEEELKFVFPDREVYVYDVPDSWVTIGETGESIDRRDSLERDGMRSTPE
jgi:hypothetical protein